MEDVKRETDDHMHRLEQYIRALNTEIKARTILIAVLEQTDAFYHNQRGEVKVVANVRPPREAHNSFGGAAIDFVSRFRRTGISATGSRQ